MMMMMMNDDDDDDDDDDDCAMQRVGKVQRARLDLFWLGGQMNHDRSSKDSVIALSAASVMAH